MKTIFSEEYLECYLDEVNHVLYHIWLRKPSSQEFRSGLTRTQSEYIRLKSNYPVLHWLADTRLMGVISIDDQHWLDKVWNDMLFVDAGVKTHAVIIGDDVFAKYAMLKFKSQMMEVYGDQNIHLDTFIDKEAAYQWFVSVEKQNAA